jgi:hypothetical protein
MEVGKIGALIDFPGMQLIAEAASLIDGRLGELTGKVET